MTELTRMKRLVAEVVAVIHPKSPVRVEEMSPLRGLWSGFAPGDAFVDMEDHTLFFVSGISKFSDFQLKGAIAHEIGHLEESPMSKEGEDVKAIERAADDYAARHGFAANQIDLLNVFRLRSNEENDDEHDPLSVRIERLQKYLPKGAEA